MTGILQVISVLVGVFVGGPVLARELETGTFRFAWTPGCGASLGVRQAGAARRRGHRGGGAFSLLLSWYFQPWVAERLDGALAPELFDLRRIDFAAWALLAFALGVLAGR